MKRKPIVRHRPGTERRQRYLVAAKDISSAGLMLRYYGRYRKVAPANKNDPTTWAGVSMGKARKGDGLWVTYYGPADVLATKRKP